MSIADLLEQWQLSQLIESFEENAIDIEAFKYLDHENIKLIIPKVGPRILFIKRYREYLATLGVFNVPASAMNDMSVDLSSNVSPTPTEISEESTSCNLPPDAIVGLAEEHEQVHAAQNEADHAVYLRNILSKCQTGRGLLSHYGKSQTITDFMRDKIVEIVIHEEVSADADKRISTERFIILSNAIVAVFPTEIKEVYFSVGYKKKISGVFHKVGYGKLYRKFYNTRRQMRQSGLLAIEKSRAGTSNTVGTYIDANIEDNDDNLQWLKNSIEPWTDVIDKWDKTFESRRLWRNLSINEYMNAFPALKLKLGYVLLQNDFYKMQPDLQEKVYTNFKSFANNILNYAKGIQNKSVVDYLKIFDGELSEDSYVCHILFLLPMLIKPVVVQKGSKEKKMWKPSVVETREGFIIHVKISGEVKPALERKRSKLADFGLTFQPTPIFVGPNLSEITTCYVSINNTLFEVPTPLKAIDVTFSIIHALDAQYPQEAEQVWYLLQRGVYGYQSKNDKKYTSIEKILGSI